MNKIIFIITISFFISCGEEKQETAKDKINAEENQRDTVRNGEVVSKKKKKVKTFTNIRSLVVQLKLVSLPVMFRTHEGIPVDALPEFRSDASAGNLLVENQTNFVYGLLPDTSNYYGIITLIPADVMAPFLFTYTKSGQLIAREQLFVKGCGFDCGVLKCASDCVIDEKLSVTLVDTNHYYVCDDNALEIPGTRKFFLEKKTFQINSNGKVTGMKGSITNIKE